MTTSDSSFHDDITDVPGVRVGHASNLEGKTGVTVVLPPDSGARAAAYLGGVATSTRQFDSLGPTHLVDRIHALCLAGGSAFGLDAAGGVMRGLEARGVGIPMVGVTIPIVPAAVIFDLNFGGGSIRPDTELGRLACGNAGSGPIEQGSVGAGTGASVGKLFGIEQGMKGGLGSASITEGDLVVAALVVLNAYGDIIDTNGKILAGARTAPDSTEFADAARMLRQGRAVSRQFSTQNTTLAVIAVNAAFDKIVASRVAAQATLGLGVVIRPFHTHVDGDITVVMAVGAEPADPVRVGLLAAQALQRAVVRAVKRADGFGILPAWSDL